MNKIVCRHCGQELTPLHYCQGLAQEIEASRPGRRTIDAEHNAHESSLEERGYIEGRAAAHRYSMLYHARELGVFHADDPSVALAYKTDELARVRKHLRELSEMLGCNDWSDELDLGDVVEKYIMCAIEEKLGLKR